MATDFTGKFLLRQLFPSQLEISGLPSILGRVLAVALNMVGRIARGIYPNGSQLCEPRCGQTREIYLWLAGMTGRPLYDVYLTHTAGTLWGSLLIPCSVMRVVTLLGDK